MATRFLSRYLLALWQHRTKWAAALLMLIGITASAAILMVVIEPQTFTAWTAFYWAVQTMTTVGYGDVVPKTVPGQILALVLGLLGSLVFLITASILAGLFLKTIE